MSEEEHMQRDYAPALHVFLLEKDRKERAQESAKERE